MTELKFKVSMHAWRYIKIKIKDEKLFKEKYKIFSEEEYEGGHLHFLNFEEDFFNDCIEEVEDTGIQWDLEDLDELDEVMENYFN